MLSLKGIYGGEISLDVKYCRQLRLTFAATQLSSDPKIKKNPRIVGIECSKIGKYSTYRVYHTKLTTQ